MHFELHLNFIDLWEKGWDNICGMEDFVLVQIITCKNEAGTCESCTFAMVQIKTEGEGRMHFDKPTVTQGAGARYQPYSVRVICVR